MCPSFGAPGAYPRSTETSISLTRDWIVDNTEDHRKRTSSDKARSVVRWPPADAHPEAPSAGELGVIELQRHHCCAPTETESNDTGTVITPAKVLAPALRSRVK